MVKKDDNGEQEAEEQPSAEEVKDIEDIAGELSDKTDLEGHVLTVWSWKENTSRFTPTGVGGPPGTYFVFTATDVCDPRTKKCSDEEFVSFAGGTVLDRQAKEMNGPFRARLAMPKGKRYWVFRAPAETRESGF